MDPLAIAVLISGGGTTLRNLLDYRQNHGLPIEVRGVVSSRSDAGGLQYAHAAGIPTQIISRRRCASPEAHSHAVFDWCRALRVQVVVMAGYLEHLLIPEDFQDRVVNIHPSLIPAFCGHGFYGLRVHQAVLDYGAKLTGCTVHFVDNQFDHGPIIAQRPCEVRADDTAETLQARVFAVECQLYPEVLRAMAENRISVQARHVVVRE